ncbi:unnamed protein product, partial [Mesorhabditis spiculigera]
MPGRLRRVTVYETGTKFYIVGSDYSRKKFNLLKIDRLESKVLLTGEPENDYTEAEIMELLATVSEGSSTVDGLLPNSAEEQRYVKIFQSVDLSTDFYFSYTYDLSRSLQENYLSSDWKKGGFKKSSADTRFVWNGFLLEPLRQNAISERWMVEVIHGFVAQQLVELPLTQLSLILVGRRSARYAGTRFLKRGANLKGDVANDVETEQIIWDRGAPQSWKDGRFTAFVQRRGSVPLRWSQDPSTRGVVGKPLIMIDIHEPHAQTAGAHFRELLKKYGAPIVVYNLVKRREKRRHESLLHEQFLRTVNYLNQFLPDEEQIAYVAFDVARCNKSPDMNVLSMLNDTAMRAVLAHGWFQTFKIPHRQELNPRDVFRNFQPKYVDPGVMLQRGISRTNCVDCLDRTNVAQFAIGKAALACQLFGMGLLDEPFVDLSSELCRAFEELYDSHGDTLAWQYAGSQLVHSIKTYKKTAALQERSRDVLQTLSRYYSNTFGDYDKQAAINLFLGIFRPQISCRSTLWELTSDYYLHFPTNRRVLTDYCAWMYDTEELEKILEEYEIIDDGAPPKAKGGDEAPTDPIAVYSIVCTNSETEFDVFHRAFELEPLENKKNQKAYFETKKITIGGVNDPVASTGMFWTKGKSEGSPVPQKKPKSKKDKKGALTDEEEDENDDESQRATKEETVVMEPAFNRLCPPQPEATGCARSADDKSDSTVLFTGLRTRKSVYGIDRLDPAQNDADHYTHYVERAGIVVDPEDWVKNKPTLLTQIRLPGECGNVRRMTSIFTTDNAIHTEVPEVSAASRQFYELSAHPAARLPSPKDWSIFTAYG